MHVYDPHQRPRGAAPQISTLYLLVLEISVVSQGRGRLRMVGRF